MENHEKKKFDCINNEVFSFKLSAYSPLPLRIISIVVAVGFTFQFLTTLFLPSIIFIFLGFVLFFAQMRIEIDLYRRLYRIGMNVFGKQFGKWLNTDSIDYLNIFPTKTSQTIGTYAQPNSAAIKNMRLHVNFIFKNKKRELIYFTENKGEAQKAATTIAKALHIGLYDCSGEDNEWTIPMS